MSLSGDIRDGHLRIGEWSAERQPGTGGVHPYRWGVKLSSGPLARGVVVHDREDGTLGLVVAVLGAAIRTLGGHPKLASKSDSLPTAEAVADALIRYETGGCCGFGTTCGLCDCGKADETPEQTQTRDAMELDRARAVLALFPEQRCAPTEEEVSDALSESRWRGLGGMTEKQACDYMASAVLALFGDQPTVAQAKAEALRAAADELDRDAAEGRAARRVAGVRCLRCDLRHEEREEYSCQIEAAAKGGD